MTPPPSSRSQAPWASHFLGFFLFISCAIIILLALHVWFWTAHSLFVVVEAVLRFLFLLPQAHTFPYIMNAVMVFMVASVAIIIICLGLLMAFYWATGELE
ncbi:hypothetical protein K402DRAFT_461334 [Aulographum hederae CBS 113979]|uniref:Uncharacterized protein n=1 Tax=Aulographum hederae CBS 113979 TaxID=1176131 RepID=A0A6G1H8S8_9PEZI|nr:hypothetical protein K402DRAFT_461334 [Aulographum hederae CBS 113979]